MKMHLRPVGAAIREAGQHIPDQVCGCCGMELLYRICLEGEFVACARCDVSPEERLRARSAGAW